MTRLFQKFREITGNEGLLILTAETGSFGKNKTNRDHINDIIRARMPSAINIRL